MIRTFQLGDEEAQAEIYNQAASTLPGFKPASADEVRRRQRSTEFDANLRFVACVDHQPVGYVVLNRNGRTGYPWCRPGFEHVREALFDALETAARQAGMRQLFAAYRSDWVAPADFFRQRGFEHARDMVNFVLDVVDVPTLTVNVGLPQRRMKPEDIPALQRMGGTLFQGLSPTVLQQRLFANRWFPAEALFVLEARGSSEPRACAILITEAGHADPRKVDAAQPCFRLGSFGNEMQDCKRIRGLFSFVTTPDQDPMLLGLDLLGHATRQLPDDIEALAGQVPSDCPTVLRFFERFFRRQGSFPIFARDLS